MFPSVEFLNYLKGCPSDTRLTRLPGDIVSITLHYIGPFPGQSVRDVVRYWRGTPASAHFVIKDSDCHMVWAPEVIAWHAGDKVGNAQSIGIEVIPANAEGLFSDQSKETLRLLVSTLRSKYPSISRLFRHYDWTGKLCPAYYVDQRRWQELKNFIWR